MGDYPDLSPTALEIASCFADGPAAADEPPVGPVRSPLAALEQAVLPALQRPPCVVSFSGGMDSSFVLFVAVRAARDAGLPPPIPVTWRFTGAPRAEESAWQERVIATMPNLDWHLLRADDDLDLIGPVAQRVLTRHGVLLPPNVHLHLPIFELAGAGSVLSGVGGDQMLIGRRRPGRAARLRAVAPDHLVAAVRQRQGRDHTPWLQRSAARSVFRLQRRNRRHEPGPLDQRLAWRARQRGLLMTCASLDTVAGACGPRVVNPLLNPGFVAALAALGSRGEGLSRADLLRLIAGDAFPAAATERRPKADFLEVFLRAPTREFVQSWDGRGADESVVDVRALRQIWSRWPIPGATAALVQHLWLSSTTTIADRPKDRDEIRH